MARGPARLELDPAPAKAVGAAVAILSAWIPVEHLRLGGGTVLEARWHHRSSTDLGFFYSPGKARPASLFRKEFDDIRMDLHRLVGDEVIARDGVVLDGTNHIRFIVGDVPVSFVRTEMFHSDPCDEVEHRSGVFLGGTKDILTKKMYNRLGINRLTTPRDAYDFAVARSLAPDDLAYAWSALTDDMKREALTAYRSLAEEASPGVFRALEKPKHGRIANDLWAQVLLMLESDLEYVPPLTRGEDDTGHKSERHGR